MSKTNTGGPFHPTQRWTIEYGQRVQYTEGGITVRDYFAAAALQGLLAQSIGTAYGIDPMLGAEYAYAAADAMIAARSK